MLARSVPPLALLAAVLVAASSWSQAAQDAPPADEEHQAIQVQPREFPQDPPGRPAQPVPGAEPAYRPQVGRFTSTQVNVAPSGANINNDAANEPSIAVDPTNPMRLAIGWRQFDTIQSNFRQAGWAYSTDGGRSWTFSGVLDPGNFRSDPVLSFDATGNFYYDSLAGNMTCDVFKSTDGGASWGPPVYAYGGDKEWMTVDRSGGIGDGNIYSFWSGYNYIFTRSTDGGQSFEPPSSILPPPHWGTMNVGADGSLYIGGVDAYNYSTFYVAKSTNAQNPEDPNPSFTVQTVDLGGAIVIYGTPNPSGLLGQVWVAVDSSEGPTAGYVYLLCTVNPPGSDPADVHFARSTDGGLTWSAPLRVNDDTGTNAWQWFATMSVSPDGRIDVIWNDTRNSGAANLSELYYASSEDGGESWLPNERISPMWDSHVGWPNQSKIGDYYDMVSDLVGADLAWAATFNGEQDVYHMRIGGYDCNINGVADSLDIEHGTSPDVNGNGIPDECEDVSDVAEAGSSYRFIENVPNPFSSMTAILFDVPEGGEPLRLQIFDASGRLVRTLRDEFASAGRNSAFWDGTDERGRPVVPGLYLCRLEGATSVETHRMLLVK